MERFYRDTADFRILVIVLYMIYMERFYSHTADFRVLVVWGELSLCEKLFIWTQERATMHQKSHMEDQGQT